MKMAFAFFLGSLLLACSPEIYAMPQNPASDKKPEKAAVNKNGDSKEGEQRFRENCGRCHTPPESISPREVKAVLQHMRVRAMLSTEDAQLILKYLAP